MINYLQKLGNWKIEKTITQDEVFIHVVRISETNYAQNLIDNCEEE